YGQAIEFQQRALARRGPSEKWTAEDAPTLLLLVELNGKQAQAYLAQKDSESARKAVQRAGEFAKQAEQLSGRAQGKPAPAALPSKLIISVPKKSLDFAGANKITYEELRKEASVEYLTFPK